jgi:bacillithiol biosynthesis cysteine-adding enzyme BshC
MAENKLYLDYVSGTGVAACHFTHPPLDFVGALESRRAYSYPRHAAAELLQEYNVGLGAHSRALENIEALRDPLTFCVVTGQQAGFLGGPVYTAYKIVTAIRMAEMLQAKLKIRVVPVFWLASEDHDFDEINHTYCLKEDGEVGRVRFDWEGKGRPVADLPITEDVRRAYDEYLGSARQGPHFSLVREWYAPRADERFVEWQARTWTRWFSERGLVLVEPRTLRPLAGDFFRFALEQQDEIQARLAAVSEKLSREGYKPALASTRYGQLYSFDPGRRRVRVTEPSEHIESAHAHPERYSTDAALRPLFADAVLAVAVSVLGPGEIAYQAMLKPLYDLFDIPQPLLYPRKSYSVIAELETERIARYGTSAEAILLDQLDVGEAFDQLLPGSESKLFATARRGVQEALEPLRPYLETIDPSLGRTWSQTLSNAVRNLDKLEGRAMRARMSQLGFSKGELQALRNALLPRGRLQERVFPLAHFLGRHGTAFVDALYSAGELDNFSHHLLIMESPDA